MKKLFIVANWKSNKTIPEAISWVQEVQNFLHPEREIIICASFTLLPDLKSYIVNHKLPIKLGGQDISPFDKGAYTGEVNGEQIKELAEYVLIGHSERKRYFGEDREMVNKKIEMAITHNLMPIVCVPDSESVIPNSLEMVMYEPPKSISPGPADNPENAQGNAEIIRKKYSPRYMLYGGNVTAENVHSFAIMPDIDGVVVGRASLDAKEFTQIIENA